MKALLVLVLLVGAVAVPAAPAAATLDDSGLGCAASLTIAPDGQRQHVIDARAATIRMPREGRYSWRGSVEAPTHDHSGRLSVRLAWWHIELGRWEGANEGEKRTASGSGQVPGLLPYLPRGMYTLDARHTASEGECDASVRLLLGGTPFGTAMGMVAVAGFLVAVTTLPFVGRRDRRRGRPVLGAVIGTQLGLYLAVLLLMSAVVASGSALFFLLPVAFGAGGHAQGIVAPVGPRPERSRH